MVCLSPDQQTSQFNQLETIISNQQSRFSPHDPWLHIRKKANSLGRLCHGLAGLSGLFLVKSSIPEKPQAGFVLRKGRGTTVHMHIHIPQRSGTQRLSWSREAQLGQHRALGKWQKLVLFIRLRRLGGGN